MYINPAVRHTIDFSSSDLLAERIMALLFFWQSQHRSIMGFMTINFGRYFVHISQDVVPSLAMEYFAHTALFVVFEGRS